MNNANYVFREPQNEPVYSYAPGTPERALLQKELERQYNQEIEIPLIIGGKEVRTGDMGQVVMPTEHSHVLAKYHKVGKKEVQMAIDAAMAAKKGWEETPWIQRASVMMKAAELLATKYRYILNAACMLGQGIHADMAHGRLLYRRLRQTISYFSVGWRRDDWQCFNPYALRVAASKFAFFESFNPLRNDLDGTSNDFK